MIEFRVLAASSDEFPGWVGIACIVDGETISTSWAPPEVPVGMRLNINYPQAYDERTGETVRWTMPDETAASTFGIAADELQALRDEAHRRGLI